MSKTRQKFLILKSWSWMLLQVFAFISLLLPVRRALAQPWFLPTEGVASVFLQNNSDEPQTLWLSAPNDPDHMIQEIGILLNPREKKSVDLSQVKSLPWFQLKSYITVPVELSASGLNSEATSVQVGRSDTLQLPMSFTPQSGTLQLANLSPNAQKLILQRKNIWQSSMQQQEVFLTAFQQNSYPLKLSAGDELIVQGQYPLTSYWKSDSQTQQEFLKPVASQQIFHPNPQEIYFLMSNNTQDQSFIFHSHEDAIIAEARAEIANPDQRKILVAKIDYGHGDFSRDLLDPIPHVWSWHVSEVFEFATLASQECDGSPAVVEDNLNSWISGGGGICFWNYKIQRELSPAEVAGSQ